MSVDVKVAELLNAASAAPTLDQAQSLVNQAEALRVEARVNREREASLDFAATLARDQLRPVATFDRHTASSDWLADIDTSGGGVDEHGIIAQGTLWYSNLPEAVKQHTEEFKQQAIGQAQRVAGQYGQAAEGVESTYLTHVGSLRDRDKRNGSLQVVAEQNPQVGEQPGSFPTGTTETVAGMPVDSGLPGDATTSERSPTMQAMEHNDGSLGQDVTGVNDPGLGQVDTQVDRTNNNLGDQSVADLTGRMASRNQQKESSMEVQCPTCGVGRVAARYVPQQKQAYSGLPQIQEIVNNSDTAPESTPLPTDVAFPLIQDPQGEVQKSIQTAEQQIAEREQRKGASLQQAWHMARRWGNAERAARNAHTARMQMQAAGYDASGWLGDMGAGGYGPGQQEPNYGGPNNLGQPDPVYGYGGDQQSRPIQPYGDDEANDFTNNQGMNWQPGQDTHADMGGRGMSTNPAPAPGFPNAPKTSARVDDDPHLLALLGAVRNRRAHLQANGYR